MDFFLPLGCCKTKVCENSYQTDGYFRKNKKNFTSNSGATYGIRTTAPEEIELGLGIGVGRSFPPGQLFWNPSNIGLKCV